MSSYWSNAVHLTVCPFFIKESKYTISCEGMIAGTETISKFESESAKKKFQENHCYLFDEKCCYVRRCLHDKYE